jgi:cell division protein ZapA
MTIEINGTTVEVLGKSFQVKCAPDEIISLQNAAAYLEEKMQAIRATTHLLSIDRIAVIAALNITHQYLILENERAGAAERIDSRLRDLLGKMDNMLMQHAQLEFSSAK